MPDVLNDLRKGLEKRLRELEPLIKEHAQIREALDALKRTGTRTRHSNSGEGAKRTATATTGGGSRRRGRPRGTGSRAHEALRHVSAQPGITIADIAKRMKIKPNYLYRILPQLEKEGRVRKEGSRYHPVTDAAAEAPAEDAQQSAVE